MSCDLDYEISILNSYESLFGNSNGDDGENLAWPESAHLFTEAESGLSSDARVSEDEIQMHITRDWYSSPEDEPISVPGEVRKPRTMFAKASGSLYAPKREGFHGER